MSTWIRGVAALLPLTFASVIAPAAVLQVPGEYTRIQSAIDSGANGDVILVSPGVYVENISFRGKAITLTSTNPVDPNVIQATIIRAAARGSTVSFVSGETSNSVLTGFTITGGYGTANAAFGTNIYWGGGIYCNGSSPTITRNLIIGNALPNDETSLVGYGCGIACIQSDALIARNLMAGNTGYAGGGIMTYLGKPRIVSNLICSNAVGIGGGAVLLGAARFVNNTVLGNSAEAAGNIYANSDPIEQCLIIGNIICSAASGGGVYVDPADENTQISFNDVWNNTDGDYYSIASGTGLNGNISQDPLFVNPEAYDYHLRDTSPCINEGDPNFQPPPGELDLYGNPRLSFGRADIGASEYFDTFRPLGEAGPDQWIPVLTLPVWIALDGSASSDPKGEPLSYQWTQMSGPTVTLSASTTARPGFNAPQLGTYIFRLVVNNGVANSFADTIEVTITNAPPIADAGDNQALSDSEPVASVTLDGSRSFDPEGQTLSYHWRQVSGWKVPLDNPAAAKPTFEHPWPGTYSFELVVNDGLQEGQPALVSVSIGPNHAPVAKAGLSRYVAAGTVVLDGTGSYDVDGQALTYQWRQVSGPKVTLTGTNTAAPLVSGITQTTAIQRCVFELVVNDGTLISSPSTVQVTIVPNYGANTIRLVNPPFDAARPTILAFGGGNCNTGGNLTFGGIWEQLANWLTVDSYGASYSKYGDMLIVYLSSVAPDYRMAIQTMGFSTGNKPAMEVGRYLNVTYRDARYLVNRISLLDAVCNNLSSSVSQFQGTRIAGEQCWVDNYISNDSHYNKASYISGTLNVSCNPARSHGYPVNRYAGSSLEYENGGLTAFAYLSVIGSGRNYQLNTGANKYYFIINSSEAIAFYNQSSYPGKILGPVQLTGPAHASTIGPGGAVFSCEPVENAVRYQLLFGSDPYRVMDYTIVIQSTNPPTQVISTLPLARTWWTVKAFDQFGSTMYADPWLIKLPDNTLPVANAGPDQTLYAGLEGKATVTLNGSTSVDPDGDSLTYTWAWALDGNPYLTNGVSLSLELPVGVHRFQLMVNDGQGNSEPAEVTVTVIAPLECDLKITPSTINLASSGPHILACLRFPGEVAQSQADTTEPLLLYPGAAQATRRWVTGGRGGRLTIFGFFEKNTLSGAAGNKAAELLVTGKLRSGQLFFGRDSVKIVAKQEKR